VLPKDARELEVWTTVRTGRESRYTRFDERLEYEVGLTDRLQTAMYLNFTSVSQNNGAGALNNELEFRGVSSEWKYKLLDPVADALGLAFYGEVRGSTDEVELEAKLILDKRIGNVLLAANLVGAHEWSLGLRGTERKVELEADIGITYFISSKLAAGIEARSHNDFADGEVEHAAWFAGPVVSYAERTWCGPPGPAPSSRRPRALPSWTKRRTLETVPRHFRGGSPRPAPRDFRPYRRKG
jgi:hypothetical protein